MNFVQRNILYSYTIIACFIMFLDLNFPAYRFVYLIKFGVIFSLFVIALLQKRIYVEQKWMFIAHFLVIMADYFIVFSKESSDGSVSGKEQIIGTICFFIAYCILIKVWGKRHYKVGFSIVEIFIGILLGFIFWPTIVIILPCIYGIKKIGVLFFGVILYLLVWTSVSAKIRMYYGKQTSSLIAMAGILILISDIVVAHATFNPAYSENFVPWLSGLIWFTYIPAWAIIVILICAPNLSH